MIDRRGGSTIDSVVTCGNTGDSSIDCTSSDWVPSLIFSAVAAASFVTKEIDRFLHGPAYLINKYLKDKVKDKAKAEAILWMKLQIV